VLACANDAPLLDTLLPALRDTALVLTGTRSEADQGSGVLPYALAAALGRPVVTDVLHVEADGSGWTVTQALPKGARRRLKVQAPAVLAISAAAPLTLRHSLADAVAGKIVRPPLTPTLSRAREREHEGNSAPAFLPLPLAGEGWGEGHLVPTRKRRQLLEAKTVQSGHARMLGAIESPSTGGVVLQTGSADSKAQAILDYLRTHSLVTF
jgi:electron transfer flavoprotein beta subunit